MPAFIDITGQEFGDWVVLRYVGNKKFLCRCVCKKEKEVSGRRLRKKISTGCGCRKHIKISQALKTHGLSNTAEYRAWSRAFHRCYFPNDAGYQNYGGRGITVCDLWNPSNGGSFENFFADMGSKPSPEHSLDRERVNENYEPTNCRWATPTEQINNRRIKRITQFSDTEIKAEFERRNLCL